MVETAAAVVTGFHSSAALYDPSDRTFLIAATTDPTIQVGTCFTIDTNEPFWNGEKGRFRPSSDKRIVPEQSLFGQGIILRLPMVFQSEIVGALHVHTLSPRRRKLRRTEIKALELLAFQAASLVYSARLKDALMSRDRVFARVQQIEQTLHSLYNAGTLGEGHQPFAERALLRLRSLVPFDSGAMYVRYGATRFQLVAARHGTNQIAVDEVRLLTPHNFPLLRKINVERKMVQLDNVLQEPLWQPHLPGHRSGSWLGIPLLGVGKVFGFLSLGSHTPDFFRDNDLRILETLTAPLGLAFQGVFRADLGAKNAERVAQLTQRVIHAQEEERRRLSRELHDEAGQSLVALTTNLELIQQDLSGQSQDLIDRARESVAMTRQTLQRLNTLARQLRPPALDTLGVYAAIEQLCGDIAKRNNLTIDCKVEDLGKLPDPVTITLYRFVQEALTNVVKHAQASHVIVNLKRARHEMQVSVTDNGKGFDPQTQVQEPRGYGRLGLLGMRERLQMVQGRLEIRSKPGDGTVLVAHVPLEPQAEGVETP